MFDWIRSVRATHKYADGGEKPGPLPSPVTFPSPKMKKAYATSVQVYGAEGLLYRESGWYAERLVLESKAERICKGKLVRAIRLISPVNPEEGHERVSSMKKYSTLGQAQDTGTSYVMREYGSKQFAPRAAQRLFMQVLADAGAEIRRG